MRDIKVLMIGLDLFPRNLKEFKTGPFFLHHKAFTDKVGTIYHIGRGYRKNQIKYYKNNLIFTVPKNLFLFVLFAIVVGYKIIKDHKIDIIHTQDTIFSGIPGYILSLLTKKPLISSFYGFLEDDAKINYEWCKKNRSILSSLKYYTIYLIILISKRSIVKLVTKRSVRVRVLNEALGFYAFSNGADKNKIFIIPMRVKLNTKISASKKILFMSKKFIIFNVGQIIPRKGLDYLIDAMPQVLQKVPDAQLFIGGRGFAQKVLIEKVKTRGLEEKIKFIGPIDPNRVLAYMKVADVFILPTLSEGMGQVFLEAMSVKTPIIATNVGGIKTFLVDKKNAILIEPRSSEEIADSIIYIENNKQEASRLTSNAFKTVKSKFTLEIAANKFKQMIGEVYNENFNGNAKNR